MDIGLLKGKQEKKKYTKLPRSVNKCILVFMCPIPLNYLGVLISMIFKYGNKVKDENTCRDIWNNRKMQIFIL